MAGEKKPVTKSEPDFEGLRARIAELEALLAAANARGGGKVPLRRASSAAPRNAPLVETQGPGGLPMGFDLGSLLGSFLDSTDDLCLILDPRLRLSWTNAATGCYLGFTREALIGRSWLDFVAEGDRDLTAREIRAGLELERDPLLRFESRLMHADGTARDVQWVLHPLSNPHGDLAGLACHGRDLTQERRVENALRRSDVRAQAVMAAMLDPMISIDEAGTIQGASDSVERVFGYAPLELVGQNIKVLMPEPHRSRHDGYLEHYRRTGETAIIGRTREFEVVRKDGEHIVCALSVSRALPGDGQAPVFTGTFRDVTELRRSTQALAESERRFHALFDHAFEYLGLLAPDGTVLDVNQTALDAIDRTRTDVVGRPFWEAPWWSYSTQMRERVKSAVSAVAAGEFVRFEASQPLPGGALIEIDFSLKPVKDETGQVVLLISEGRNVSELKAAQRTETAMLRAFATIGESAALLAHEIKNPITAVHVALRAVATELGEDHRVILEDLIARMKRLEEMMRRTLSFAKPLALHLCPCDAEDLFRATQHHLRSSIEGSSAHVDARVAPGGVHFLADPSLMQDVLSNLVTNALEAQSNGVHVTLSSACADDGSILLSVEDDGPGVPRSLRESLFKPFVTTKSRGNGLGLAICRKIVEEHGGTLDLAEGQASGARFEIRLPAKNKLG